jgi:two-component system sensor histidine kinase KdpD
MTSTSWATRWPPALRWAAWILALLALTAALVPARDSMQQSHVALLLLLVVLGASATVGFAAGMTVAVLAFALLSYFFEFPRNTVDVPNTLDLTELATFLVVAFVAARLLTISRQRARLAEARAVEILQLADERARLENEAQHARVLAESARMKDALLAAVSHDLRTPLTTIRALAERRAQFGDADWRLVGEETDRLTHLVRELLDYSRIRGGALPVRLETYPAEDLVGAVVRESGARLAGHTLVVEIAMGEPILAGRFDLPLAARILVNLVENAAKYATPATNIVLAVRGTETTVEFSVRNEGAGVGLSERERIFEPFVRGTHAAGEARASGVGLGLAIARSLAEMQSGIVQLEAGEDGAPTVFTLSLPRAAWDDDVGDDPPA